MAAASNDKNELLAEYSRKNKLSSSDWDALSKGLSCKIVVCDASSPKGKKFNPEISVLGESIVILSGEEETAILYQKDEAWRYSEGIMKTLICYSEQSRKTKATHREAKKRKC